MPSKNAKQHRLMEAAAHTRGGYGGVPQKVGKDFAAHDKAAGTFQGKGSKSGHPIHRHFGMKSGRGR